MGEIIACMAGIAVWYLINKKLDRIQRERTAKMQAIMEDRRRQNKLQSDILWNLRSEWLMGKWKVPEELRFKPFYLQHEALKEEGRRRIRAAGMEPNELYIRTSL